MLRLPCSRGSFALHASRSVKWIGARGFATTSAFPDVPTSRPKVKIVEVGPRDGLQNEKNVLSVQLKTTLIDRLVRAGIRTIETGSYVSSKWVPRMAGTKDVMMSPEVRKLRKDYGKAVEFPVLVPNMKGLEGVKETMNDPASEGTIDEVAIFCAATDAFSKANTNCSVQEGLDRTAPLAEAALKLGLRVRGYVSVALVCPYTGRVDEKVVEDLTDKLIKMGCYEVSVADTVGVATPAEMESCFNAVARRTPMSKLAVGLRKLLLSKGAHCHDTYGSAVANVLALARLGVPTVDSAIAGLGGCPYSPGATGNVATEDVVYALEGEGFDTGLVGASSPANSHDLSIANSFDAQRADAIAKLAETGAWISNELDRPNSSRVGKAILAKKAQQAAASGSKSSEAKL